MPVQQFTSQIDELPAIIFPSLPFPKSQQPTLIPHRSSVYLICVLANSHVNFYERVFLINWWMFWSGLTCMLELVHHTGGEFAVKI